MKILLIGVLSITTAQACELSVGGGRLRLEKTECAFPTEEPRPCYQLVARSAAGEISYGVTPLFPGTPAARFCIVAPTVDLFRAPDAQGPRAEIDCKTKKNELTFSWMGQKKVCPIPST